MTDARENSDLDFWLTHEKNVLMSQNKVFLKVFGCHKITVYIVKDRNVDLTTFYIKGP